MSRLIISYLKYLQEYRLDFLYFLTFCYPVMLFYF